MSKHTAGPWAIADDRVEDVQGCFLFIADVNPVLDSGSYRGPITRVQSCDHLNSGICIDEMRANAYLIAAAPDLLEALKESVKDLVAAQVNARKAARNDSAWEGVSEAIQPSVDRARAAIAKARGES